MACGQDFWCQSKGVVPDPGLQSTDEQPPPKKCCGFFSSLIDAPVLETISSDLQTEVDNYCKTLCLPEEADPLSFWNWKCHAEQYPSLAKLAPKFLCIPASSAPVERLFSTSGKIFCPDRCHQTDQNSEHLMFFRCNL